MLQTPPAPRGRFPDPWLERLRGLWECARAPRLGFRARAARRPGLKEAGLDLLLTRTLPTLAALMLGYREISQGLLAVQRMDGPLWDQVWSRLPDQVAPADLRAAMAGLPTLPGLGRMLPWLALLAPLGVLSLWLHDAVWDHMALWLLGGLGGRKCFRTTLVADAEALNVATLGTAAGLLKFLPGGMVFAVLLLPVGVYFWVLRGYALAAWHGCPPWKGVVATLLHAFLMGILVFGTLAVFAVLVLQELRLS
jgi:hypothetical protein